MHSTATMEPCGPSTRASQMYSITPSAAMRDWIFPVLTLTPSLEAMTALPMKPMYGLP